MDDLAKQEELAALIVERKSNRDQTVAEIREHSTGRRRVTSASYIYAVSGEVMLKGRGSTRTRCRRSKKLKRDPRVRDWLTYHVGRKG